MIITSLHMCHVPQQQPNNRRCTFICSGKRRLSFFHSTADPNISQRFSQYLLRIGCHILLLILYAIFYYNNKTHSKAKQCNLMIVLGFMSIVYINFSCKILLSPQKSSNQLISRPPFFMSYGTHN